MSSVSLKVFVERTRNGVEFWATVNGAEVFRAELGADDNCVKKEKNVPGFKLKYKVCWDDGSVYAKGELFAGPLRVAEAEARIG